MVYVCVVLNENQVSLEYGGIKSTDNQPSRQVISATQGSTQQAGTSNTLALPGTMLVLGYGLVIYFQGSYWLDFRVVTVSQPCFCCMCSQLATCGIGIVFIMLV